METKTVMANLVMYVTGTKRVGRQGVITAISDRVFVTLSSKVKQVALPRADIAVALHHCLDLWPFELKSISTAVTASFADLWCWGRVLSVSHCESVAGIELIR
jgi:hypothetical protein